MSLEMQVNVETGRGTITCHFCNEGTKEAPRILRFLARMMSKHDIVIDSMDFDGTCRFRVVGKVLPAMKAFRTEAMRIRTLIDESDK